MIVLWGIPGDSTLMLVRDALRSQHQPHIFLNQHDVIETSVSLQVSNRIEGTITIGQLSLDLAEVTGLYLRPYETNRIPVVAKVGENSKEGMRAIQTEDAILSWADLTSALVVNRPKQMAFNSSKPYQCSHIERFGLEIPRTLITTEPELVEQFSRECGAIIYKSISAIRSVVAQWIPNDSHRIEDVVWCPTQFQEMIRGVDYRVHIVGEEVYACRIRCSADDYRYAGQNGYEVELEACDVPTNIAQSCIDVSRHMGLHLSGVDLRLREDGRWYCFEVNPSPAFAYYQNGTGQDIASAVARLLVNN